MPIPDLLQPGTRVRTTQRNGDEAHERRNWMAEAILARRWGVTGTVLKHYTGHGLCYDIRHDDDRSIGCYDQEELALLAVAAEPRIPRGFERVDPESPPMWGWAGDQWVWTDRCGRGEYRFAIQRRDTNVDRNPNMAQAIADAVAADRAQWIAWLEQRVIMFTEIDGPILDQFTREWLAARMKSGEPPPSYKG